MYPTITHGRPRGPVPVQLGDRGAQGELHQPGRPGDHGRARHPAEIIARTITTGGVIIAPGHIQANAVPARGHLECKGLIRATG